jgi:hypothetical protein
MSNIAMCDNCGTIFSLNAPGWDSYTRNRTQVVPGNNQPVVIGTSTLHMCPKCNRGETGTLTPRLALPEGDK